MKKQRPVTTCKALHSHNSRIRSVSDVAEDGRQLLLAAGFSTPSLISYMKKIEVLCLNRLYRGFGVRNRNGGIEFYSHDTVTKGEKDTEMLCEQRDSLFFTLSNDIMQHKEGKITDEEFLVRLFQLDNILTSIDSRMEDMERSMGIPKTVTIERPGLSHFPFMEKKQSRECCVFATFFDFAAYKKIVADHNRKNIPLACDCIVMNDLCNFVDLLLDTDNYLYVYCFFPDTILGQTMTATLETRVKDRMKDMRDCYQGAVCLQAYEQRLSKSYIVTKNKV